MAYHRFHGMDTKIVRIFNTYGPRMRLRDGRVVPAFIGEALTGAADHGFRRWLADAFVLLRLGFDRRHLQAVAIGFPRAGEHRQPARDDDQAVCGRDSADHRGEIGDRVQAAAGGRSEGAATGYHAGEKGARLGTARCPLRKESCRRSITSAGASSAACSAREWGRTREQGDKPCRGGRRRKEFGQVTNIVPIRPSRVKPSGVRRGYCHRWNGSNRLRPPHPGGQGASWSRDAELVRRPSRCDGDFQKPKWLELIFPPPPFASPAGSNSVGKIRDRSAFSGVI